MARKRRSFELFSLSFLDCICCGFGAMLLLFVLLIGKHARDARNELLDEIRRLIVSLDRNIEKEQQETGEIRNRLQVIDERLALQLSIREVLKRDLTVEQNDRALMLLKRSSLKEEIERLLAKKEKLPTQKEEPPLPIPNLQRRQYLTGMNFEGHYMVIMIEASGGMLGYDVDDAMAKQALTPEEKRRTEKWRRVVHAVQWIVANLGRDQNYQIVVFNEKATPLVTRNDQWLDPLDRDTTADVIAKLDEIVPQGGANLERAFIMVRSEFPSVDSIVLITDSLPTQSESIPFSGPTTDRDRERFFRAAVQERPRQSPINTILFPMSGDPAAPYLFWQLADDTKGSLISPAPSWPDI
jgi:hypothetical protein